MSKFIDNIPTKNENQIESDLGKPLVTSNVYPATKEANVTHAPFQNDSVNKEEPVSIIKLDKITNMFTILSSITKGEKQEINENKNENDTESDDESMDIEEVFKNDWLNNVFLGTVTIIGLFMFYRMIHKSK